MKNITRWMAVSTACVFLFAIKAQAQDPNFIPKAAAMYKTAPNIAACQSGELADAEKMRVLDAVNAIRATHSLPLVVYDYSADQEVMEAALIMAANGKLSHTPPSDWTCWTQAGFNGSKTSNLYGGVISPYLAWESSPVVLNGWLSDARNAVADNVGHRRWLLDPFLEKIAFGRVSGQVSSGMTDGAVIKIFYGTSQPTSAKVDYVAYPVGAYPVNLFHPDALLSFGVLVDKRYKFGNQRVDYSAARITVKGPDGPQPITNILYDTHGFGLPNNLQFKAGALKGGVRYDVTIDNVTVNGDVKTYSYWFLLDPLGFAKPSEITLRD